MTGFIVSLVNAVTVVTFQGCERGPEAKGETWRFTIPGFRITQRIADAMKRIGVIQRHFDKREVCHES
jgi:hypothetical protein